MKALPDPMSSIRPWRQIERRKTRQIQVGPVAVGGDAPISVQSMTNTPTHDVAATLIAKEAKGAQEPPDFFQFFAQSNTILSTSLAKRSS